MLGFLLSSGFIQAHYGPVFEVAISPDGRLALSVSQDGNACVWELASGQEMACMPHLEAVYTGAFSPDGKRVVTGAGDGTARVWDAQSGLELARGPLMGLC